MFKVNIRATAIFYGLGPAGHSKLNETLLIILEFKTYLGEIFSIPTYSTSDSKQCVVLLNMHFVFFGKKCLWTLLV